MSGIQDWVGRTVPVRMSYCVCILSMSYLFGKGGICEYRVLKCEAGLIFFQLGG